MAIGFSFSLPKKPESQALFNLWVLVEGATSKGGRQGSHRLGALGRPLDLAVRVVA
jgi:hypothetical protein